VNLNASEVFLKIYWLGGKLIFTLYHKVLFKIYKQDLKYLKEKYL